MKNNRIIKLIKLIIAFFILILLPVKVFALPMAVKNEHWCVDFNSRYDSSRSTVDKVDGQILLKQREDGQYVNSGIGWTNDARFSDNIYSIYLSGSYYEPANTKVMVSAMFDNNVKQYPLKWNSLYYPQGDFRKIRLKVFLATDNNNITPSVNEVCLHLELLDLSKRGQDRRDDERVRDLEKTARVVANFYEDFKQYPVVDIETRDKSRQWELLRNVLSSASDNYFNFNNYERGLVEQIKGVDYDYKYGYLTGNSGFSYLLWVKLEDTNSEHFEDSWTGQIMGVNCAPPTFCLYSKSDYVEEPKLQYFDDKNRNSHIRDSKFIKTKNDPKVWFVLDDYRFWIRSPEMFKQIGGEWDKVSTQSNISNIPFLKFIRKKDQEDVYLVTISGLKRRLPNLQTLYLYGNPLEIVELEDDNLFNILPNNYLVRGKDQEKVYFLDQGIKRWISSQETFEKLGLNWDNVVEINLQELDYYSEAAPIF